MEVSMAEKRITVWVQRFNDRPYPMLQWLDPETGRRKSKSAGTADEQAVEDARADLEYELTHGKYQEASRMTWERFREVFEEEYVATLRPHTQENYRVTLDLFETHCKPSQLRAVSERTVSAFASAMRQKKARGAGGTMASTIKVRLQFLHTALAWAVDQGLLPKCPRFPSIKVPRKKPQPIPAESFERLLAKAPDQTMRAYLLCGWLAGLRLREAFYLEWETTETAPYLDLTRNRIVLPAGFVKSVEDQWLPLDPALKEVLVQLPRHSKRVFRFIARDGHAVTESAISDRVIRLAKNAGVRLSMHTLRKGFGCRYASKVPAQVLQRLMRHSDIKTTMDYYANIDVAVEEAILGLQRNSSRNSTPEPAAGASEAVDATSWQDNAKG
jgi:integrase